MKNIKMRVIDPVGLHARPATVIVMEAQRHIECEIIVVTNDGKRVDTKSIMSVMASSIKCQDIIEIQVEGDNEQNALDSIVKVAIEQKIAEIL